MRILLAQKLTYIPALTGAAKVVRTLLEQLASRGHSCRVLALRADAAPADSPVQAFDCHGVDVHAVPDGLRLNSYLIEQIKSFNPTWTLVSEDPTYGLLAAALDSHPQGTIVLSQSQATLPFGPESFQADTKHAELLGRAAGIIAISRYLDNYMRNWGGLAAWCAPLPIYGSGPFQYLGSFDNPYVTMINPSSIKGISIFLELARRFPNLQFAGVCTWATTAADRLEMEQLPNIRTLPPDENIDNIFAQTRILVAPSLWGEALGMVAVEAMLRGIPVLASDVGGLREAMLGVDYLLPVRPIERYEAGRDDKWIRIPVVPAQEIGPWLDALHWLVSDRENYEKLSLTSRKAALEYVSDLTIAPFEEYLERLSPLAYHQPRQAINDLPESIRTLSPERLELLAQLLRSRK